jgi:tetratricopeptide (TPR) repeat protein
MNIKSPLVLYDSKDSITEIFELLSTANQGKRYAVYYDLTANADFFFTAIANYMADTYIVNASNSVIVQFWKVISEQPQTVIDTYSNLVKRFSAKQDLATRSKFYQDTLELFNLSAQEAAEETSSEKAVLAGNFAFLINHASTYKLPLSKEQILHCEPPVQLELPEIDASFSKKVHDVSELFQRHVGKITFACKPVDSYLGLVTAQDLVMTRLDRSVLPLLTVLESRQAAFVALGDVPHLEQMLSHNDVGRQGDVHRQNAVLSGHMVRVVSGPPELVEHMYVASHLVRPYFGTSLIRYDLVASAIADRNLQEAASIVEDAIVKLSNLDQHLINEQEEALARVWAKVLKLDWRSIRRYDDFFRLGGNPTLVLALLSELRQLPQVFPRADQLTPEEVHCCSPLKSLTRRAVGSSVKRLVKGDKSQPAIILVHSLLGDGWSEYEPLVNSLKSLEQPVYALQAPALSQAESYDGNIVELALEYQLALLMEERIHPDSPVVFVCFSSGGLLGTLIAQELALKGYDPHLIFVDCLMPDLTIGQREAEQALLPILNDKLGPERQRSVFNQRQYDFGLWLFRQELRFFAKIDVIDDFPEKTVALVTQQSPERLILGHSQIKNLRRFNADHFTIMQLPECITAILDYCRGVTETFRATQRQSLLFDMPQEDDQEAMLYSDAPLIEVYETDADDGVYEFFLLKLCDLIVEDRLPSNKAFDEICCNFLGCLEKSRAALKNWLILRNKYVRNVVLQPLLREIAINLIEQHYSDFYQKIYEDRLYSIFECHSLSIDPKYYISTALFEKFNSQKELSKEDLIAWWRASGKAIYFEELRRTFNKVIKTNYWSCRMELHALKTFFKVALNYKTPFTITSMLDVPNEQSVTFEPEAFRTVETKEAYQPARLIFKIINLKKVVETLNLLKCCISTSATSWDLYWRDEVDKIDFKNLDSYQRGPSPPLLAKVNLDGKHIYINVLSTRRLALLAPFFYKLFRSQEALITIAYFYTILMGCRESLPNLWSQISLKEADEVRDYQRIAELVLKMRRDNAASAEESRELLENYCERGVSKDLLPIESYQFDLSFCSSNPNQDELERIHVKFLSFYVYLRGRELTSIRRWFGEVNYTLKDAAAETVKNCNQAEEDRDLYLEQLDQISVLEQEVEQDAVNVVSWQQLGCLYLEQENLERSLQCFMTVVSLAPENALAHQQLALVYVQQNDSRAAEESYRLSIAGDSNFGNNFDFAMMLYEQGKYEEALTHFLEALLYAQGNAWMLSRNIERKCFELIFGKEFNANKFLINDKQFIIYLGLVLCLNKIQSLHLKDFYILRLVDLMAEHKNEKFYREILEEFMTLVDFKNDVISEQYWKLIDVESSPAEEADPYSWTRLKRLVTYYPTSDCYHFLAKIAKLLKKIDEHDDFLAIAISMEGDTNNLPKYSQTINLTKLLVSSLTRALQGTKISDLVKEQGVIDSNYQYRPEDMSKLLEASTSSLVINVLAIHYLIAEQRQDREKLAIQFKAEMTKALQSEYPSIMPISLTVSPDHLQYWIGLVVKPNLDNSLKPTIYIIDSLGSGFEMDLDVSQVNLFELLSYKEKSPKLWEGVVKIVGFLNSIERFKPKVIVTALKQQSDLNGTGPCTVQSLVDVAEGRKLSSYTKQEVMSLRLAHSKIMPVETAPSLIC